MEMSFQQKLNAALQKHKPNSRNLAAFAQDLQYYLEQTQLFSKVKVQKTGDPDYALLAKCTLRNSSTTHQEIVTVLERVWNDAPLHYNSDDDAYEFRRDEGKVQMDFLTVPDNSLVVTGRIEVLEGTP